MAVQTNGSARSLFKDASHIITQQKTVRPHNITLTNNAAVEIFSLVGVNMSGLIKNQH